jgi:hypothetical protein
MKSLSKRNELIPRMSVPRTFSGAAINATSGQSLRFRGVDVSIHGLGCVVTGSVSQNDKIQIQMGNQAFSFEVMWVESYLGIEQQYRVGLQCLDRMRDIRAHMVSMGVVLTPIDDEFAA